MNTYLFYAKLLQEISSRHSTPKSLILSRCQSRSFSPSQIKRTYSIIINSHRNLPSLQQVLNNFLQAFPSVKISNHWLFLILLHEYFREEASGNQKKALKGGGFLIRIIKKYHDFFEKEISSLKVPLFAKSMLKTSVYLRIVASRLDLPTLSLEISKKTGKTPVIVQDPEVPDLVAMDYEDYSRGLCEDRPVSERTDIVIQGKSSCFPAWVLCKSLVGKRGLINKRFDVIDACAAPGNKTLQLCEYLLPFPKASLLVFEKNKPRFELLSQRLENYALNAPNTRLFNQDFLLTEPSAPDYSSVRLLLLDPSCSGSGMRDRLFCGGLEEGQGADFEGECRRRSKGLSGGLKERVERLKGFQIRMLLHAMAFPNVLRICYSTCSLYEEENEQVVERVLEERKGFKLVDLSRKVKGLERGFGKNGKKCLRANPFKEQTDGFFIALFKRTEGT